MPNAELKRTKHDMLFILFLLLLGYMSILRNGHVAMSNLRVKGPSFAVISKKVETKNLGTVPHNDQFTTAPPGCWLSELNDSGIDTGIMISWVGLT